MKPYGDTSFLVSLYLTDSNSEKAVALMRRAKTALPLTSFQRFELHNALRLCLFRKLIGGERLQAAIDDIQSDFKDGILTHVPLDWTEILREAERLSAASTETLGNRGIDVIHVASALVTGSTHFLTFDDRQRKLAKKAGLISG